MTKTTYVTHHGSWIKRGIVDKKDKKNRFEFTKETCIFVKDSGIGMDSDILNRLFKIDEKISRRGTENEPSSGLGLLLYKEFVERHNRKIWVESEQG